MQIEMLLSEWQKTPEFVRQVTAWNVDAASVGKYAEIPRNLHDNVHLALKAKEIRTLYSHQAQAIEQVLQGEDVVIATPTASGKTLCYNLPVLDSICKDASARALYIFPTKALAQDQVAELHELIAGLQTDVQSFTYDGDTPMHARQRIREAGHIVVTNPDMLHAAILPHHTKWLWLFENLKYIIIDEMHMYRGIFGSHFANVLRRLLRICSFYGTRPQFILSSATIANPDELAHLLTGRTVRVVDSSGAPHGERHYVVYNPPIVNPTLGLRRSSLMEARRIGVRLLTENIHTIAFVKTRTQVEVLSSYWKNDVHERIRPEIMGYRGGYLPSERRKIERDLRSGQIRGVVSTNALELGVDIGSLDASITVGYPGSIAALRQQSGRAGRRQGTSLALYIANASPLDQYVAAHPGSLFEQSPESARIHPENLLILMDHVKCAAYELPFSASDSFGVETTQEMFEYLADERVLNRGRDGRYYWMSDALPSHGVSLRSAAQENVVIIDTSTAKPSVIGETDRFSALTTLHEEAIYLHQSKSYQVEKLDLENGKAFVRAVEADYYTDAELSVRLQVLDILDESQGEREEIHYLGEVMVNAMATLFKKLKFDTHENLGWGKIHLPEAELHTVGYWCHWPLSAYPFSREAWESALKGAAHVLRQAVALHCMCMVSDIHAAVQIRDSLTGYPTLYLYDAYPGGIGIADRMYRDRKHVFQTALGMVTDCPCESGCPACVGPVIGELPLKPHVLQLLNGLTGQVDVS